MFCKSLVRLLVPSHLLALSTPLYTTHLIIAIMSMYCEKLLPKTNILAIDRIEITFTEREVVYGIEQIGLTSAIIAHKAIDIAAKYDIGLCIVLKVG